MTDAHRQGGSRDRHSTIARRAPRSCDRVVIRFAGDSGDGMQLTGDRFTERQRAVRQRPADAARLPGRDPGPGRHARRRLGVPGPHLRPRHHHARRRAERAGGDEPGGAEGRAAPTSSRAARSSSTPTPSTSATSTKAGYATNPLDDGSLDGYTRYEVPMTIAHQGGGDAARREAPRRRALEELLRPRPDLVDVHPPDRADARRGSTSGSRKQPAGARRQPRRVQGRATTSARPPSCSTTRTRSSRRTLRAGHVHATSPATPRWRTGSSPPASWRSCRCSSASYPITPASDILHELSKHKNFGVRTLQAEDEIAGIGAALGAAFARPPRRHHHERSRRRPQVRDDRPGRQPRAAAAASSTSSAAVRPPACRPRPSRPTCCSRCTAATARRRCRSSPPTARRTASTPRSRRPASRSKYRTPVILLTDGYLANGAEPWQLPDVDDAARHLGRRSRPSRTTATPTAPEFWPYLRDPETLARPWAIPGTPGLMHRIGGIEKEDGTGNISYDPENHERMVAPAGRQGRRHRQRHPARRGRRRRDDAELLVLGWGSHVGRHRRRRCDRVPGRAARRSPTPTSCTSTRSRANLGEVLRRYPKVLVPEMNLGQLSQAGAGRVPRRRQVAHARSQGVPVHRRPSSKHAILEMLEA